jgi:hypothetical protein
LGKPEASHQMTKKKQDKKYFGTVFAISHQSAWLVAPPGPFV